MKSAEFLFTSKRNDFVDILFLKDEYIQPQLMRI